MPGALDLPVSHRLCQLRRTLIQLAVSEGGLVAWLPIYVDYVLGDNCDHHRGLFIAARRAVGRSGFCIVFNAVIELTEYYRVLARSSSATIEVCAHLVSVFESESRIIYLVWVNNVCPVGLMLHQNRIRGFTALPSSD